MRAQNLKRGIHVGEERRQIGAEATILKVVQPGHAPAGGNGLEEFCRGQIGVDAGRGEQADQTLGLDQAHGALHEERVEVYVAAAQQWIVAGSPHQPAQTVGAPFGVIEVRRKRIALGTQFLNGGSARRRRGGAGEFRRAGGKPLHFLQLDAVPGRVADHGVESAARVGVLPLFPHPGKGRLPVQKGFAVGDGSGVVPEGCEFGSAAQCTLSGVGGLFPWPDAGCKPALPDAGCGPALPDAGCKPALPGGDAAVEDGFRLSPE